MSEPSNKDPPEPGAGEEALIDARRELIRRARQRRSRVKDFPNKWHPTEVLNPAFGDVVFTDVAAWEFIADRLERGVPFHEVPQEQPPGVKAFEMVIDLGLGPSVRALYVKVRLGHGGQIMGRSFHYSTK
jgi:hypothetical protein